MSIPFIDLKTQYQDLKTDINRRIQKVLDHGQYILGPEVTELERVLSEYTGAKHTIACSSGTDAALLALMAMGVGPGDEVIMPAFSFIATAEVVALLGATPVMVDIQPETYNVSPEAIKEAVSDKTKAIMPVSLYGQPADMDEIIAIAKEAGVPVIEDAAQSFGSEYKGHKSCNLSDFGCTSFFPAKPLGCYGDGGAVFTNDDKMAALLRELLGHGSSQRYYHTTIGINGRIDTLQCAVLLAKMTRFPDEVIRRQKIAQRYSQNLEGQVTLPVVASDRTSVWAQYTIRVSDRSGFQEKMKEQGVPTAVHYPLTMADQPAYKKLVKCEDISHSRKAAEEVVSLPMHPEMDESTQDKIINAVKVALN